MFMLLLGLAIGTPALADVFQWKDENGHMQMSDHPPPESSHVKVLKRNLMEGPASPANSQESADVRKRQDDALNDLQAKRAEALKAKKEADEQASRESSACEQLKKQQGLLNSGGRMVTFDSDGQRRFSTDDELKQKREDNTRQQNDNHCN
jgi:hypothetical protein